MTLQAIFPFQVSGEVIAFLQEFGTSWNMCMRILLIFPCEGPACGCLCSCAFVGWNEYQDAGSWDAAVSVSGKGAFEPLSARGGAKSGLRGLMIWDP